jgi:alkylated DNA repair dioxygenase AlkB
VSHSENSAADLFGEPVLPDGFRYRPDVISAADEKRLVARFETLPLKPFEFHGYLGNRRIFTFGHKYMFAGADAGEDHSIPNDMRPLMEIAGEISGQPATRFEQIMVTEYAPGAGIGWHRDKPEFADVIAFSLLAPCTLRFRRAEGETWQRRKLQVEPRSAYLLRGAARWDWYHSIPPVDALRYSVTFRNFAR